jgi:LacI family transcriptional regulator
MGSTAKSLSSKPHALGNLVPLAKLRQVAAHAGVSVATASRALNHPALLAPKTLERVRLAIEALDFVRNPSALALSHGRSRLIGALIPTIDYSIFANYMQAMQDACTNADYTLVLSVYRFDAQEELRQAQRLVSAGVEGLLLVGFNHDARLFDAIGSRKVAYVCTSVYDARSVHPNVGYDNFGAGKRIAEHLLSLGHKKIGVITGATHSNDRMAQRLAGIRFALLKKKLSLPEKALYEGEYTMVAGREGFQRVFQAYQPSALICGNDVIGLGALQQALTQGLSVPRDLSIFGFDGLDWTAQFSPALTTMQVPMERMGQLAARSLIARIEGRSTAHAVKIPILMALRETTAQRFDNVLSLPSGRIRPIA